MPIEQFQLPIGFDLFATFLFALTGALVAMRKGYDFVGVWVFAFATGAGGGLIRDGIFLQQGPPLVITDSRYLLVITVAAGIGIVFGTRVNRLAIVFALVDALALGVYAVVGAEKANHVGLGVMAAVLVGVTNAVGGSLLRDLLAREEPMLFKPSQFYAVAALVGSVVFLVLAVKLRVDVSTAALVAIAVSFVVRVASVRFGWKTAPVAAPDE